MQPRILAAPQRGDLPALLIVQLSQLAPDIAKGLELGVDKGVEGREECDGGDACDGEVPGCHGVAAILCQSGWVREMVGRQQGGG